MTVKFASRTLAYGGNIEVTMELWTRIYRLSRNSILRNKAIEGIMKVIRDQIIKFRDDRKRLPDSLEELRDYGYIPYIPSLDYIEFSLEEGNLVVEQK